MRKTMFVILTVLFLLCCGEENSKEILFVCMRGSAGSPIAALHFNRLAKERDLNYHAVFRGVNPDNTLAPEAIEGLIRDGFDVNSLDIEKLSKKDLDRAYKVVKFDCSLPFNHFKHRTINWKKSPHVAGNYDKARDVLKERVEKLIKDLMEGS